MSFMLTNIFYSMHRSRTTAINSLEDHQGLLVLDWAMKFVPIHFRESQRDWFAKKGRNWHVSVLIYKGAAGELEVSSLKLKL